MQLKSSTLFSHLSLALTTLGMFAFSHDAHAQNQPSAGDENQRFEISGSYFRPNTEMALRAQGTITDGTTTEYGQGRTQLDDDFHGGQLEAQWKFSDRQRLTAGWYRVGNDKSYSLDEIGTFEPNPGETYDYDASGRAAWDMDFELYRLSYGFDVLQTDDFNLTALVSAYGAHIDTGLKTEGTAIVNAQSYDLTSSNRYRDTRYAPGLGLAAQWTPADRWDVRASVEGFRTEWGDFDNDGHFTRAQAQVGYKFHKNWTGFVGYDWFELELKDDFDGSGVYDGVTYAGEGSATARLRVHGPTAGLRASF